MMTFSSAICAAQEAAGLIDSLLENAYDTEADGMPPEVRAQADRVNDALQNFRAELLFARSCIELAESAQEHLSAAPPIDFRDFCG